MKTNHKLALALLTGATIGFAGADAIHMQQIQTPPVYVIAEVEVTDRPTMKKYGEKVPETGALQSPLSRPGRQDPGLGGRTAQGHRRNRLRQRREGA